MSDVCIKLTAWALQVVPGLDKKKASADSASLVEVGPRVCLNPIKIFGGSFGGPVLFDNPHFVSPNRVSDAAVAMLFCMHVRQSDHDAAERLQGFYSLLQQSVQETAIHFCTSSLLPMCWSVLYLLPDLFPDFGRGLIVWQCRYAHC